MATHEIAEKDWKTYFEAFSEKHKGALVSIEDVDPLATPRYEMHDLPFVSLSYKSEGIDESVVELVTESKDGVPARTVHIHSPKEVFHKPGAGVLSSEVNTDEVLEITSKGKPPVYYLTFRHPA